MRLHTTLLTGLLCLFATHAAVQGSERAPEKLVVYGEKDRGVNSTADVNLEQYSGFEKLVRREDFQDRLASLDELVDSLTGIQVRSAGGLGGFSAVSIRGSSSKQVNMFIDGMLINSIQTGITQFSQIPAALIEEIQAFPDFTPVELGNASLAGAINIKTLDSFPGSGGRFSTSYGSFASSSADLSVWNNYQQWSVLLSLGGLQTDNDFNVEDVEDKEKVFKNSNRTRQNAGFKQRYFYSKISRQFDVENNFQWFMQYSETDNELPTTSNTTRDTASLALDSLLSQWRLDHGSETLRFNHSLSYQQQHSIFKDLDGVMINSKPKLVNSKEEYLGLTNGLVYKWQSHRFTSSIQWQGNHYQLDDDLNKTEINDTERDALTLAAQDSWQPHPSWQFNTLWRYYYIDDSISQERTSGTETTGAEQEHIRQSAFQLGIKARATSWLVFKANAGKLIRLPTLSERFAQQGRLEGTEELKTERGNTVDFGALISTDRFDFSVALFHRDIDQGIFVIYDARGTAHPQNIDESTSTGIETDLLLRLPKHYEVFFAGTYIDSKNDSQNPANKGKKLPGIYHESSRLGFRWNRANMTGSASYAVEDELYYVPANTEQAQQMENIELSMTYSIAPITVDLSIRNIQDKNHLEFNRMPSPKRSVFLTLNFDF